MKEERKGERSGWDYFEFEEFFDFSDFLSPIARQDIIIPNVRIAVF